MFITSAVGEGPEPTGKSMLEAIPSEVKDHIFSYLPQESLHCLLFTSPALSEEAAIRLYHSPEIRTTYRFAQFVTTVSHSQGAMRIWCVYSSSRTARRQRIVPMDLQIGGN